MRRISLQQLIMIALFVALQIVFTRFLSLDTGIVRVSAAFIPLAFCSIMCGPVNGGIAAGLADVIGFLVFPRGTYFPGFTLTAFLAGIVYGVFLHDNPNKLSNYIAAVLIVSVVLNLCLDTLWLNILLKQGYLALLPSRILKSVIMAPVEIIVLRLLWKYLGVHINKWRGV